MTPTLESAILTTITVKVIPFSGTYTVQQICYLDKIFKINLIRPDRPTFTNTSGQMGSNPDPHMSWCNVTPLGEMFYSTNVKDLTSRWPNDG